MKPLPAGTIGAYDPNTGWFPIVFDYRLGLEQYAAARRALADAWQDGRYSFAQDLLNPIGPDGQRPSTPNPYRTEEAS